MRIAFQVNVRYHTITGSGNEETIKNYFYIIPAKIAGKNDDIDSKNFHECAMSALQNAKEDTERDKIPTRTKNLLITIAQFQILP